MQDGGQPEKKPEKDDMSGIGRHMVTGSAWMIGMRWVVRGIGLLSTVILARLLLPEDFGIVAMAAIVYGLLEALSHFGLASALIQNTQATRAHYNTAWTVQIAQHALIAAILLAIAPLAASYFGEPRVEQVIQVLALAALISGFENIGIVDFQKDLQFGRHFRFNVYKRLIVFVVTIGLAIALRNYWALVIGILCGRLLGVALSYVMHPFRPRLSLAEIGAIWGFSQWILVAGVADYLLRRMDQIVVGRTASTDALGAYHVSYEISSMTTSELALPIARALFPSYAKIKHDVAALRESFLTVQGILATLCLAIGFGLGAVAEDAVLVLLGARWSMTAPLIQWLSIAGGIAVLSGTAVDSILLATGHVRRRAGLIWLKLAILTPGVWIAATLWSVEGVAIARLLAAVAFTFLSYWVVCQVLQLPLRQLGAVLWRPFIAAAVMFVAVRLLHTDAIASAALRLMQDVATGVVVYVTVSVFLWWLAGRPEGAERMIFRHCVRRRAPS